MIRRLDHINIVVSDLEAAQRFFSLLGFSQGVSARLDARFLETVTGIPGASGRFVALHHPGSEVSIEILQFDPAGSPSEGIGRADRIGYRHMAFAVADIEGVVEKLRENGVEFISPIQTWEKTGKRLVYFYGPDGILMELAQYPDET